MRMSKDYHIVYVISIIFCLLVVMCRSLNTTVNLTNIRKSANKANRSVLMRPVNTGKDESNRCGRCDNNGGILSSITQHWMVCKMKCMMYMYKTHFRVLRNGQCVCGQGPDYDISCATLGTVGCWSWCLTTVVSVSGVCDSLSRCHCGPITEGDPSRMYDQLDHPSEDDQAPCCD